MFGMIGLFSRGTSRFVNVMAMNSSFSAMFFALAKAFIVFSKNTENPIKKSRVLLFPSDSESWFALLHLDMSGISSKLSWCAKNISISLYGSLLIIELYRSVSFIFSVCPIRDYSASRFLYWKTLHRLYLYHEVSHQDCSLTHMGNVRAIDYWVHSAPARQFV